MAGLVAVCVVVVAVVALGLLVSSLDWDHVPTDDDEDRWFS